MKRWCNHIIMRSIGGIKRYVLKDNRYIAVNHWNYCPYCGKEKPIKEDLRAKGTVWETYKDKK